MHPDSVTRRSGQVLCQCLQLDLFLSQSNLEGPLSIQMSPYLVSPLLFPSLPSSSLPCLLGTASFDAGMGSWHGGCKCYLLWNSALASLTPGPKGFHGNLSSIRSKYCSTFNTAHVTGTARWVIGSVTFALSDSLSITVQVHLTIKFYRWPGSHWYLRFGVQDNGWAMLIYLCLIFRLP